MSRTGKTEQRRAWGMVEVDATTAQHGAISITVHEDVDSSTWSMMTLDEADSLADWIKEEVRKGRQAQKPQ